MVFTTVNTVVVAPIPSARVKIAKKEKAGALRRLRNAYFVLRRRSETSFPFGFSMWSWVGVVTIV